MKVARRCIGILALAGVLTCGAGSAAAATVTFLPTGAEQTFQVPLGVTTVRVVAVGGRGADGNDFADNGGPGGFGALAMADVPVTPQQTLYVEVGGNAVEIAGGWNGGGNGGPGSSAIGDAGGGGGSSDVRTAPRAAGTSLLFRLITAAGGGGGGGEYIGSGPLAAGGTAGATPTQGVNSGGSGGGPGSATQGGAAGGGCQQNDPALAAKPGGLGVGGQGAGHPCGLPGGGGGGGGGAGVYGGGGGAASSAGGGGGAGWSGFGPGAKNTSIATDNTAAPSISITYTPGTGGGGNAGTPPAKPKLQRAKKVRVGKNRRFSFSFTATPSLKGSALERTTKSFRIRGKRRKVTLAKKSFTVPAGGKVKLRLRLSKSNFALLKRRGKLGSRIAITVSDSAGRKSTASAALTLVRPKR